MPFDSTKWPHLTEPRISSVIPSEKFNEHEVARLAMRKAGDVRTLNGLCPDKAVCVEDLCEAAGVFIAPHYSHSLYSHLNICSPTSNDAGFDLELYPEDPAFNLHTANLADDHKRHLSRFIICRELAETLFLERDPNNCIPTGINPSLRRSLANGYFCDVFAAFLLVPPTELKKVKFDVQKIKPDILIRLSNQYDAPCMAIRWLLTGHSFHFWQHLDVAQDIPLFRELKE